MILESWIPLLARVFLSALFIASGISKVLGLAGTVQYMQSMGLPFANLLVYPALAAEILGGLSVLTGFGAKWGALLLFLYLIPTTLIFHTDFSDPAQQINFMKNLAIMGGLLLVFSFGPGPRSLASPR